jgi:hypothetical protein
MRATAVGLIVCALLMAACGPKSSLTEQEKKVVNEMTTDLKSHCVGRYVVDMPGNVVSAGWVKFQGVMVKAEPKSVEQFEHEMDAREAVLKATRHVQGYRFLYDYGKVRNIEHTRYFVSLGDDAASSDASRVIEAYKWDRGYQLTLTIDAIDFQHSADKDQPWVKAMGTPYDAPQKTQLVFDLIEKLQGRAEDSMPTEPGACFFGGFLPGKAISQDEEIHSYFALPDKPDVSFSLETFGNLKAVSTLLKRFAGHNVDEALKAASGRRVRTGSIDLPGGMKADEGLMSALTSANPPVQGQHFSLEANYSSGPRTPYIVMDMDNGDPSILIDADKIKRASLSEGEAVALWDAVSRTLRPRPNGF